MKIISFFNGLLISTSALASTWNCPIKNETALLGRPDERVVVEVDRELQTITYIHQVANSNGTFIEKPESMYSVLDKIRGGFPIAYCESDQGHIALEYKMLNWNSKCSTAEKQMPLNFVADFYLDQPGYIQVQILDLGGGNNVNRFIRVSACQ